MGLILANWKLAVIGVLFLALAASGLYIKLLKSERTALESNIAGLTDRLQISQDSVKLLQASIDEQNAAIQSLKTVADARELAARQAIMQARAETEAAKRRATTIIKYVKPVGVSSCDAANALINKVIEDAK